MATLETFPQFGKLPLEIRNQIWKYSLQTPRLLHVVYNYKPSVPATFKVRPASTGGRHPSALSVNRASRAEALRHLTLLHGAYWNLAIDSPYFEVTHIRDAQLLALSDFARGGHPGQFERMAVDWLYVDWARGCCEKMIIFRRQREAYENVIDILNSTPGIKSCFLVYRAHTLEKDFIILYKSWTLGPLMQETTLAVDYESAVGRAREEMEGRKAGLKEGGVEEG